MLAAEELGDGEQPDEIQELADEADLPLDELLARYGYVRQPASEPSPETSSAVAAAEVPDPEPQRVPSEGINELQLDQDGNDLAVEDEGGMEDLLQEDMDLAGRPSCSMSFFTACGRAAADVSQSGLSHLQPMESTEAERRRRMTRRHLTRRMLSLQWMAQTQRQVRHLTKWQLLSMCRFRVFDPELYRTGNCNYLLVGLDNGNC